MCKFVIALSDAAIILSLDDFTEGVDEDNSSNLNSTALSIWLPVPLDERDCAILDSVRLNIEQCKKIGFEVHNASVASLLATDATQERQDAMEIHQLGAAARHWLCSLASTLASFTVSNRK